MKRLIFTILIISLFVGTAIAKDIGPLTYADSNVENDTLHGSMICNSRVLPLV